MKRLLFLFFVLSCSLSYGQTYQSMPQAGYGPVKRMLFDSVVTIPIGITSLRNITGGKDTAQIRYNKSDSSIYVYSGTQWIKVGGASVDSTTYATHYYVDSSIESISTLEGVTLPGSDYGTKLGVDYNLATRIVDNRNTIIGGGNYGVTGTVDNSVIIGELALSTSGNQVTNDVAIGFQRYIGSLNGTSNRVAIGSNPNFKDDPADQSISIGYNVSAPMEKTAIIGDSAIGYNYGFNTYYPRSTFDVRGEIITDSLQIKNDSAQVGYVWTAKDIDGNGQWRVVPSSNTATKLITNVYNSTGTTIAKGSVVYINGRHSSNLPTVALAQANDEANSYKTFALVETDIPTSSSGFAIQAGKIENLNLPTSTYTDGDIVYLSPTVAGGYTLTKPLAPNHIVKLGSVTRAHPTQGSIEIKIENGWQLDELSDVSIPAVPADSVLLQFKRTDSLWHDVTIDDAFGSRFNAKQDTSTSWKTGGNYGVNAGQYIGSVNNASLRIRTNNTERMVVDSIGRVAIGTTSATASSLVDMISTTSGLLIPRMTTTQRNAISSPASQLLVANTTNQTIDQYNGTAWSSIAGDYNKDLLAIQALGSPIKSTCIGSGFLPNTGSGMTSNRSYFNAVYIDKKITSTGVAFYQATQGVFTGNNFNGLALYSYSGGTATQIAITANDANIWKNTSNTWVQVAWTSSVNLEAGIYYIGALYNNSAQTTAPVIGIVNPVGGSNYFAPLTTNSSRLFGGVVSGVTALPSSQACSSWTNQTLYFGLYLY